MYYNIYYIWAQTIWLPQGLGSHLLDFGSHMLDFGSHLLDSRSQNMQIQKCVKIYVLPRQNYHLVCFQISNATTTSLYNHCKIRHVKCWRWKLGSGMFLGRMLVIQVASGSPWSSWSSAQFLLTSHKHPKALQVNLSICIASHCK